MDHLEDTCSELKLGQRHRLRKTEHGRPILDVVMIDYDRNARLLISRPPWEFIKRKLELLLIILDGIVRNDKTKQGTLDQGDTAS